jgi:hypothetical protein
VSLIGWRQSLKEHSLNAHRPDQRPLLGLKRFNLVEELVVVAIGRVESKAILRQVVPIEDVNHALPLVVCRADRDSGDIGHRPQFVRSDGPKAPSQGK